MTSVASQQRLFHARTAPRPSAWVQRLFGCDLSDVRDRQVLRTGDLVLTTRVISDAVNLPAHQLQRRAAEAYESISNTLVASDGWHPVRFWNFIPHINEMMGHAQDRYMVFNAGRFTAFVNWYGGAAAFPVNVASATAVGHDGDDLAIWCLASRRRGIAVENPRQRPSYTYSSRYGRFPPSFARATIVNDLGSIAPSRWLLAGGTASVRDEQSLHVGRLRRQVLVTLQNLALLVQTAVAPGADPARAMNGEMRLRLERYRELRVYHVRPADRPLLRRLIEPCFPAVQEIEWDQANLCRSELLVEIEGVAALDGA